MRDPLTRTLLILTFATGIVDVVSFLALGQVFAAMQTGNVIFLGLSAFVSSTPTGIASESELTLRAAAIAAILAGAIAGALLLKTSLALAIAAAAAIVVAAAVSQRSVDRPYTGAAASSRSISSR